MHNIEYMNFLPKEKPGPVVKPGEFVFAAIALDHVHIIGMCEELVKAGAILKYVYDPNREKCENFSKYFQDVKIADSEEEIFNDPDIKLIAGAAVPSERCALGLRVMEAGKDYFTDKCPMTTLKQLEMVRAKVKETGRKYMVYYSERLHSESAEFAGQLIKTGAIGDVIQVMGLGPHRLEEEKRPSWFFEKEKYGGILCDIGSHQIEQYLYYSGAKDATVVRSQVGNYNNPNHPELEDFGEAMLVGDNGTTNYFRVDWFTPDGLGTWGDGRTMILGTKGYIEIRKYIDVAVSKEQDHVILVNNNVEEKFDVEGKVGYPFFGQLILDCINRTENAMTQEHAFKAAELCIKAQMQSVKLK